MKPAAVIQSRRAISDRDALARWDALRARVTELYGVQAQVRAFRWHGGWAVQLDRQGHSLEVLHRSERGGLGSALQRAWESLAPRHRGGSDA